MTDNVDIWHVQPELLSSAQQARCLQLLDDEERARHDRFVFERDRLLFRVSHAMMREVLASYLGTRNFGYTTGHWGRPELAEPVQPPLYFNLSHTHGLAALLVAGIPGCGVDVEGVDRLQDPLAIAEHSFAPSEVAALHALATSRQRERFFAYWTLKEAYIKARGMGLSLSLQGFAFDLETEGSETGRDGETGETRGDTISFAPDFDDPGGPWWFQRWSPTPRHRGALALRGLVDPVVQKKQWPGP